MEKNGLLFEAKELLEARLEKTKQRYAGQQAQLEILQSRVQKSCDNIEQMEYTLKMMERFIKENRMPRVIRRKKVNDFMIDLPYYYERLQSRLKIRMNYNYFCCTVCARYQFECRPMKRGKYLSFISVYSKFKRERGR